MNEYRYQAVEQRIMDMIDNGTLGLGDRLPSLRKLGRDMGVSISTATQAYTELERKGVVEAARGPDTSYDTPNAASRPRRPSRDPR
ncbi:GntR family transcriptional regulator, partial [Salidesulfovibrio brasiliensis]|uniref:GntR family transcriptional regulator n=1 Tax=Salidesulfovibrio brasiliensis TaxID=221711 RepID=UPI0006D1C1C4